jgi:D-sedoheptulose 7-phosphate isomerase
METRKSRIIDQIHQAKALLEELENRDDLLEKIVLASELFSASISSGGKVFSCGNGGSMSDAMHFAEELTGKFRDERRAIPAIAISDPGHISCVANDFGYEYIFSRYIEAHGGPNDALLAISTSGNSQDGINAAKEAGNLGMKVVALTGNDGGKLGDYADIEIRIPHLGYADRIQEMHIKVIHWIIDLMEMGNE